MNFLKLRQLNLFRICPIVILLLPLLGFEGSSAHAETYPITVQQGVNKQSVYTGEQIIYEFSLSTQTSIYDFQPPELSQEHAWTETIAVNQRGRKVINGDLWNNFSTRRAVYPLMTGQLTFPALTVPVGVRVRTKRKLPLPFGFEDAFGEQLLEEFFADFARKQISLTAEAVQVKVNPLPPLTSNSASISSYVPVGATHLSGQLTQNQISLGESAALTITVVSTGNLNPLKELVFAPPAGLRVYPEADREEKSENNGALITRKIFRFSLVPISAGNYQIPALSLTFFDPDQGSYQQATTRAYSITANATTQQTEDPLPSSANNPQMTIPAQASPETVPSPAPTLNPYRAQLAPQSLGLIGLVVLTIVGFTTSFLYFRLKNRKIRQTRSMITKCATPDQLANELREIFRRIFNLPERDYTYEEWIALLSIQKLPAELRFNLLSIVAGIEQNKLAQDTSMQDLDNRKQETFALISAIIKALERDKRSSSK